MRSGAIRNQPLTFWCSVWETKLECSYHLVHSPAMHSLNFIIFQCIAEPRVAYECSSDDRPFHYQLLQYSEQDQYTLPCVIKPGRLRSRYEIVWATVEPDSNDFTKHNTINPENFDLTLNSNFLPQNEEFLSCRVKIRHDSTTQHRRSYCGYRIQTAGTGIISCAGVTYCTYHVQLYVEMFHPLHKLGKSIEMAIIIIILNLG